MVKDKRYGSAVALSEWVCREGWPAGATWKLLEPPGRGEVSPAAFSARGCFSSLQFVALQWQAAMNIVSFKLHAVFP